MVIPKKKLYFLSLFVLWFIISGCGSQSAQISKHGQLASSSDFLLVSAPVTDVNGYLNKDLSSTPVKIVLVLKSSNQVIQHICDSAFIYKTMLDQNALSLKAPSDKAGLIMDYLGNYGSFNLVNTPNEEKADISNLPDVTKFNDISIKNTEIQIQLPHKP